MQAHYAHPRYLPIFFIKKNIKHHERVCLLSHITMVMVAVVDVIIRLEIGAEIAASGACSIQIVNKNELRMKN